MKIDLAKYALQNLAHRKLRSWLTILSILIGITAIFVLISFGLGLKNYIAVSAEKAGADKILISSKGIGTPGLDKKFYLTEADSDFVGKISGVKNSIGTRMQVAEINHKKEKKNQFIMGYEPSERALFEESFTLEMNKGRSFKDDADEVVLGYNYLFENKLFKKPVLLGDKVKINNKTFEVVGFYNEIGQPEDDGHMYISDKKMEELFPDTKDKFAYIVIKAEKDVSPGELADKINEKLRKHKGQEKGKETFFVETFEELLATFQAIINILTGVLILIALVSTVVASINIANTMYTAVLERTNEIGIMKAIGAKNSDILFIFVFESGVMGLIGGTAGVVIGYLISSLSGAYFASLGYALLKPIFPLYLTLGCILFAFLVGAIAGLFPAMRASKLKPE